MRLDSQAVVLEPAAGRSVRQLIRPALEHPYAGPYRSVRKGLPARITTPLYSPFTYPKMRATAVALMDGRGHGRAT